MEHGHANHLSDDWSCTAYWYQAAPVTSVTIQPVEERIPLKRTFDIPKPAHQVELTPEMQEAYRSRNERMEKFKVEKAEQIRLNAARTAPSEAGNKELAHKVKKEFDKNFEKYDVLLTPVAPTTAFGIGEKSNNPLEMYLADICTVSINIAGVPAISIPCGVDSEGMPIGMQLIGNRFDEETILNAAYTFEQKEKFREKYKPEFKKGE